MPRTAEDSPLDPDRLTQEQLDKLVAMIISKTRKGLMGSAKSLEADLTVGQGAVDRRRRALEILAKDPEEAEAVALYAVGLADSTWEPQKGKFSTHAINVGRQELVRHLLAEAKRKERMYPGEGVPAEDRPPPRHNWHHELRRLVQNLEDPKSRAIIQLRYFDELSQKETAMAVGLSQQRVSEIEQDALAELRALW